MKGFIPCLLTALPLLLPAGQANAERRLVMHGQRHLEECMAKVLERRPGRILKIEFKLEPSGRKVYEFDLRADDLQEWDLECDADNAEIVEIEREVASTSHPDFAARSRIDEKRARAIALRNYPGEINEIEYEIEADGAATYEFDILLREGGEMKVEVDAGTGRIIEADREQWQLGYE